MTSPSGPLGKLSAFDKGETIFREGDAPGFLATIASGRVKVVKMLPSGKETILEIFEFLSLETCIGMMSRWGKQGIVSTERDGFVVRDAARLARFMEA